MAVLGPADQKNLVLPSLWDNTYINNFRLESGQTFEAMLAEIRQGLQMFNVGSLLGMTNYGGMIAVQDTPEVEYAVGTTAGVEEFVEYKPADPRRGQTTGHMIGLKTWNRTLGWTMLYLMKARQSQLDADLRSAFLDIGVQWQQRALTRFFKSTADTLGSTGKSVPLADGGTADANYVPYTSPRGDTFTSSHNHFLRQAATLTDALVIAAIKEVWHHGHNGPYTIIIPEADISTWQALSNFRIPTWADLNYLSNATVRADLPGIENDIFGYYESPYGLARVWATPRLPTGYYGVFKSYGAGDARNPLRVRFDPKFGLGWNLAPGMFINAPQYLAVMMAQFDFGIGQDRTNGVCVYNFASGNYVDPTIS